MIKWDLFQGSKIMVQHPQINVIYNINRIKDKYDHLSTAENSTGQNSTSIHNRNSQLTGYRLTETQHNKSRMW